MNKKEEKYKIIKERIAEKGCTLTTTLDEYCGMTEEYKKVSLVGKCGHMVNSTYLHEFFNKGPSAVS